jgi:hypothetical protein
MEKNQKQFQLILLIVNNLTKKIIKENFHYLIINLFSFQVLESNLKIKNFYK